MFWNRVVGALLAVLLLALGALLVWFPPAGADPLLGETTFGIGVAATLLMAATLGRGGA